ncbi:GNAT family N-acetyltransferase [Amycolatopsis sp. PS_44_ISF1]|uniref:GNAT family N-acetyltransferase n=1 Tax=Amycolatopsis sp. PS_44_ISF1 TaxID=2974917 RepID=UPI0028DF7CC1|nr:GNAT family N-acetyltransferase [Amycolatopsis sp. PS_44_ISF1]MDT8913991.1 GNAT family N-acetyltransferase [Amycolatopsis sp. PS_44_ISF1]
MHSALVRPAGPADLGVLAAALGEPRYFEDRLTRQAAGLGVLLTAWRGPQPAGVLYLWLEDAEEAPIRWHLPRVPLLTHLEVREGLRNQGIGRALVEAAEQRLVGDGHERGALAVRTDNQRAARLYRRLGYRDWGRGTVVCHSFDGVPEAEPVPELCFVLVKRLVPAGVHQPSGRAGRDHP